ncbi:hypothetical protein DFH08DRAFT_1071669 [Mycena albidolilacea]|uniref:Uncharacterized protein n=1 Tax=Mycena albidolilacea TaxID=1033008 RepID=A0AAD7AW48_9AGAR|nr:hypothetical protein DFH08DRAFT_1071669 [Mycena albidolilacea]
MLAAPAALYTQHQLERRPQRPKADHAARHGLALSGSFSEELVPRRRNSGSTLLDTTNGKTYLPTPDDVQHAVTSVGQAAKTYLPPSLAALGVVLESRNRPRSSPADVPVTDDSALRTPSTEAQAGSLLPPRVDSLSSSAAASVSDADSGNLSTVVHTGGTASPHPVPPLSPADSDTIIPGIPLFLRPWRPNPPCSYLLLTVPLAPRGRLYRKTRSPHPSSLPSRSPLRPPCAPAGRAAGCVVALERTRSHPTPRRRRIQVRRGHRQLYTRPVATGGSWPPVQSEGRWRVRRRPPSTPAVPGSIPINPDLADGAPDFVTPRAPQGAVAPGAGMAEGKDAPLPLDAPHFTVVDSGAASEGLAPWRASRILFQVEGDVTGARPHRALDIPTRRDQRQCHLGPGLASTAGGQMPTPPPPLRVWL